MLTQREIFLLSLLWCTLCSVHAVAKAICSDALKIHLANQMIWVYSIFEKIGMTVWPNVLSWVQFSSQLDLEKCCIPQLLQLSAKFIWVNFRTSNCKRFEHLHQDCLDTEVLTPSRPANAPSLFAKFGRQLLVGPQDAWRPNQRFHLLQFWALVNKACCWPLVSYGKLLHSKIQIGSHISTIKAFGPKLTSCKLGPQGVIWDILHILRHWRHSDSAFGFGEKFLWKARVSSFPSPLLCRGPIV